mgnify:CR=1
SELVRLFTRSFWLEYLSHSLFLKPPSADRNTLAAWAGATAVSMIKLWHRVRYYYLTHDGIEMLLFTCVLSSFVWIA